MAKLNLANLGGINLRPRLSLKQALPEDPEEVCRPWRKKIFFLSPHSIIMNFKFSWISLLKIILLVGLIGAIATACLTLPIEKILKDFLIWIEKDLGPWGPIVLAVAYIPLTVLAVPASILTLGGGYLFGLPVGLVADSIGATIGAGAAFLLGRTIGRSYVISKLRDYPKFRAVAIATHRSGFKIVLLLRLVPLLPFNMLNYLLSVTSVPITQYMLASWLGMMPITFALVYVGTTLKDLSDVTHGWHDFSKTRWAFIVLGLVVSVMLLFSVMRVAKAALEKALAENECVDLDGSIFSPQLPVTAIPAVNLNEPLIIQIDANQDNHEK
ncbi:SNARE associated Golgi protein family [Striga asiatica]|uniref:SNARE associated Golgi protein family n=1 Tax=Striga asiatica TaxID=4170 RepID=A0A5A7PXR4_STRAF|nr:SNARE associated Golgi protein family [Striga asiatica]